MPDPSPSPAPPSTLTPEALEAIRKRDRSAADMAAFDGRFLQADRDRRALLAEVDRLRAANQAVRAEISPPAKPRDGTCRCSNCKTIRAEEAASFECKLCGYQGEPDTFECSCYDYCCHGGDMAGAGCPHGATICPVCQEGEDESGWDVVKRIRAALLLNPAPAPASGGPADA